MASVISNPTPTTVSAAATSTNAIPNLHGGAHPATPKLAGIVCGSCILFAWTVCLIYWYWNRRKELQDLKEIEANEEKNGVTYSRRRAAADRLQRIESAEQKEREKHRRHAEMKRADSAKKLEELARSEQPLIPNGAPPAGSSAADAAYPNEKETHYPPPMANSAERAGGHVQDWERHHLTPMQEVPTRDEL
ncbi:hypothetical protein FRB96_004040 [Tulasnella sp. 330]|nr:hypothetical protein FRB96_004040 [Tulasnella sp. 330]